MVNDTTMLDSLSPRPIVVGANHHSSTMMMRDRIFVEDQNIAPLLAKLEQSGIDQAILLATCDRVEVIGIATDPDGFEAAVLNTLAAEAQCPVSELKEQTYTLIDAPAVAHIFSVTASLDSLMIGEPQVLGQVKHAHRLATDAGFVKAPLETLMQSAYSAAKRVRTETKIGEGPVGMAASAVQIARDIFGDLSRAKALLIGTGDMGELIAHELLEAGLGKLTITHQRAYRATDLARELGADVADFSDLEQLLCDSDIVLSALGSRTFRLHKESVAKAIKARRFKPVFIVDVGVPRDLMADVEELDEAFVYGLGDLEQVALKGRAGRELELHQAKEIISQEVNDFSNTRAERTAVPALVQLRTYFESERQQALIDGGGDAEKATRLLVGRLLHGPSEALRQSAAGDEAAWAKLEYALEKLFDLKDIEDKS
jgi:glutamyl-tRNA reductase